MDKLELLENIRNITKATTDETEGFNFQLGTTF